MSENTVSKSQAKRQARQEENKKLKRQAKRDKFIGTAVVLVLCAVFVAAIGSFVYYKMTTTTASSDYAAYLNADGTIKNVTPTDYIEPLDYKNITVATADIEYTEDEINTYIDSVLESNKIPSTDAALTAADGDTLNIDYVGTVDGEEFEGGSTDGNGADLILGSGSYVDGFEDQLIGSHPGDSVTVNVTFPEDYTSEELQGKDAVFEVVVNSIYVLPEFNDAFVAETLSEYASTVEEYRAYLKETNEELNLKNYLANYVAVNSAANSYDEGHIKYLKAIGKYEQESYYNSYNQMYITITGSPAYSSFEEYTGMATDDFELYLEDESKARAARDMTYQYIFADAGLSISDADYEAKAEELGSTTVGTYGKEYVMQMLIQETVIEYLAENATIQ